jgi:hypothetical protein
MTDPHCLLCTCATCRIHKPQGAGLSLVPRVTQSFLTQVTRKRHADQLSFRQLGRLLHVSFSTLARIERGEGFPDAHTTHALWYWLFPEPTPPPCRCTKCAGGLTQTLGWECPRCHGCYPPTVVECPRCAGGAHSASASIYLL